MSEKVNNIILIIFLSLCSTLSAYSQNYVVFRIDDMGLDDFNVYYQILPLFEKYNAKLTIGVVPIAMQQSINKGEITSEDIDFIKKYIDNGVVEIAQHGFAHYANYQTNRITSEFYEVNYQKQYKEIKEGKEYLTFLFDENIKTFIPPWNAYDNNTLTALVNNGFNTISAARYGAIDYGNEHLNYLPYTITLKNYYNNISRIKKIMLSNKDTLNIIAVMIHSYDFKFNNKGSRGKIGINEMDSILFITSKQINFESFTINELTTLSNTFDNVRLSKSVYNKSPFTRYMYKLNLDNLLSNLYFYKTLNLLEKNAFVFIGLLYYSIILFIGFILSFLCAKIINDRIYKFVISSSIVFLIICVVLFTVGILGKSAVAFFLFNVGFIFRNILSKEK